MSSNTETSVMDQILDRAIEQNPQSSELLKAFGPIIARQRQLSASIVLTKLDYSSINREKLRAGVSVIQQISLFVQDDPLAEIALSLISKGMDQFYVENKMQESSFVCDKCKKYLVTLYRAGRLYAWDMDISAISLVHLDMIMQDKGYEPMIACAWNVLS